MGVCGFNGVLSFCGRTLCFQRPAPESTAGDCLGEEEGERVEQESGPSAPKRPAPSFNFRPSLLQQATQGFSLKPSSLASAGIHKN